MPYRVFNRLRLVLQISEAFTGEPVDKCAAVSDGLGSRPIHKRGGYYIFTDFMPERVFIVSDYYYDVKADATGPEMRLRLVKRQRFWERDTTGCRLRLKPDESVNLYAGGRTYKLAADVKAGDLAISLFKTDFDDISLLYSVPLFRDGSFGEVFFISGSLGSGIYSVDDGFKTGIPRAGCAIAPLCALTADSTGDLIFPAADVNCVFLFREDGVKELKLKRSEMNTFNLEE